MRIYENRFRSNYFLVRYNEKFKEWAEDFDLKIFTNNGKFAIGGCEGYGFPEDDPETGEEIDFAKELSKHLHDGEIAVLMQVGYEDLRFLSGVALAVNSSGDCETVCLADIYEKAAEAFGVPEESLSPAAW